MSALVADNYRSDRRECHSEMTAGDGNDAPHRHPCARRDDSCRSCGSARWSARRSRPCWRSITP